MRTYEDVFILKTILLSLKFENKDLALSFSLASLSISNSQTTKVFPNVGLATWIKQWHNVLS